jgi:Na+-translocating ferredoxin:NAD+ oxidoreductase RnfD subunit
MTLKDNLLDYQLSVTSFLICASKPPLNPFYLGLKVVLISILITNCVFSAWFRGKFKKRLDG